MLLSDEEIRTLTFKAPYVYEHGDRPYFIHEVNRVAERLGEQSTLNFFVRYRSSKEDANQHKWSRIVKVVSLAEWGAADREQKKKNAAAAAAAVADNNNSSNSGRGSGLQLTIATDNMDGSSAAIANGQQSQAYTSADVASSTMPAYTTWRRKTFTTSFVLEGEEDLVYFQRLSANLPSKEEVADYCARQAARVAAADGDVDASSSAASSLRFIDAVDTAAAPSVLGGVINSDNTAAAVLGGNNSSLRSFLPTSKQIEKLRVYKQAHITEHQWTSQEIEQTREMNARLGRVGAAAAPVAATRNQVHNMKVETELGIARTSTVTGPGAGVGPMMAARRATASDTLDGSSQERMLGESIGDESTSAFASRVTMMSQQQTSFVTGTPQSVCMSPRSPFLPRKLQQRHIMPVAASSSSSLFPEALLGTDSQSSMTWGDTAHTPLSTQLQQGSPPLASQQQKFDLSSISIASETLQQWEQSAHHEHRFYSYISNAQRSAYVNKVAAITQRNYGENKRIRLQGIDNEKRLERKGNLLESGGLWVTDDVTRAKKAALYKASMEEGSDGGGGAGKAADAGGDKSEKTREEAGETRGPSAQDIAVEKFLKRRRLQELPFDEAIPDSLLEGEEEIVVGEGVAVAIPHGVGRGKVGAAPASGEAGMNARLRVSLTESPPEVLRSQLLVRSSSRMALGGRSSSEKASH